MTRKPRAVDPVSRDRLKWALLGSGYVHVGAVLLLVGKAVFLPGAEAALASEDMGRMVVHLVSERPSPDQAPGAAEPEPPAPRVLERVVQNDPGERPATLAYQSSVDSLGALEPARRSGPQYLGDGGGHLGGGQPARASGGHNRGGSSESDGVGGRRGAPLAPGGERAATGGDGGWLTGRAGASGAPGDHAPVESHRDLEVDPIPELQQALGFASFDRSRRPSVRPDPTPGPEAAPGGADYQRVASRSTPLGVYIGTVEELIHERWVERELPIEQRARGIQGTVSIAYRIDRAGRIHDPSIVRSSGNPALDQLALQALPERLPPLPRALGRAHLDHKVNLTYRNPLIAMGSR